jgi:hypothetical protein
MDEFEKIQKLIRLKKYESPGEDFVSDFVSKFRERQRGEMLKQSALSMFWEQVKMHFSEAPAQKWALAAAIAVMGLASVSWLIAPAGEDGSKNGVKAIAAAGNDEGPPMSVSIGTDTTGKVIPAFSVEAIRIMAVEVEPDPGLLSKHFQNGYEQFIVVPHQNSKSTIAVPYEFVRFEGKPGMR